LVVAIYRFTRAISYQNILQKLLAMELKNKRAVYWRFDEINGERMKNIQF